MNKVKKKRIADNCSNVTDFFLSHGFYYEMCWKRTDYDDYIDSFVDEMLIRI